MSQEIIYVGEPGQTDLYTCIFKSSSGALKVWRVTPSAWLTWNNANIDDYDVGVTESGYGVYSFTFPAEHAAGKYFIVVFQGDKTVPEIVRGAAELYWDGSAEITLRSIDTAVDSIPASAGQPALGD